MVISNKICTLLVFLGTFIPVQARWAWVADDFDATHLDAVRLDLHDAMRAFSSMTQGIDTGNIDQSLTMQEKDGELELSVTVDPKQQDKIKLTQINKNQIRVVAPLEHGHLEMIIKKRSMVAHTVIEQKTDRQGMHAFQMGSSQIARSFSTPVDLNSVDSQYAQGVLKLLFKQYKQEEKESDQRAIAIKGLQESKKTSEETADMQPEPVQEQHDLK